MALINSLFGIPTGEERAEERLRKRYELQAELENQYRLAQLEKEDELLRQRMAAGISMDEAAAGRDKQRRIRSLASVIDPQPIEETGLSFEIPRVDPTSAESYQFSTAPIRPNNLVAAAQEINRAEAAPAMEGANVFRSAQTLASDVPRLSRAGAMSQFEKDTLSAAQDQWTKAMLNARDVRASQQEVRDVDRSTQARARGTARAAAAIESAAEKTGNFQPQLVEAQVNQTIKQLDRTKAQDAAQLKMIEALSSDIPDLSARAAAGDLIAGHLLSGITGGTPIDPSALQIYSASKSFADRVLGRGKPAADAAAADSMSFDVDLGATPQGGGY